MTAPAGPDTEDLLQLAATGDGLARQDLLGRHRDRLRRMVAIRMDRRLVARVDPSDVVQEALAEAHRELDGYLRERPLPFYPWLRRIAWECLVAVHHRHITAKRRSIELERQFAPTLPEESAFDLADRLIANASSPSRNLLRSELRERMREALARLAPNDREVLVLRHLEGMRLAEIASVLGISEGTVKVRQTRALVRLRAVLDDAEREDLP